MVTSHLRQIPAPPVAGPGPALGPARWMVVYDGSAQADQAVLAGLCQAREHGAALFIVATDLGCSARARPAFGPTLGDDLMTFVRFGAKAALDVDGTVLAQPTVENLLGIVRSHGVTGLIVDSPHPDGPLGELAAGCGLPCLVATPPWRQEGAA